MQSSRQTFHSSRAAAELPDPAQAETERGWAALQALLYEPAPPDAQEDPEALRRWVRDRTPRLREAGMAFYAAYPDDPRRWDVVVYFLMQSVADLASEGGALIRDEQKAWAAELEKMRLALERSTDASPYAREQAAGVVIQRALISARMPAAPDSAQRMPVHEAPEKDSAVLRDIQRQIDDFAERFPEGRMPGQLQAMYLRMLERRQPDAVGPLQTTLLNSPNVSVRAVASGRIELEKARREPLEMRFTALDGREVDLVDLRGKVVLIEFWATWCKPCIAEIPHLKEVYERYRAQGFEVIGVALDRALDRQKLLDLVAEHGVPWPQFFDGRGMNNPYAQRFAVSGVPFALLLDREGRLATTEVRGPRLEVEVSKLLGSAGASS